MIVEHLIKLTFGINCDQKDHIQRICGMIFKSLDNFCIHCFAAFRFENFTENHLDSQVPLCLIRQTSTVYPSGVKIIFTMRSINFLIAFIVVLFCFWIICRRFAYILVTPFILSIEQLHFLEGPPGCGLPDDGCFQDFKERGIIPLHVAFRAFLILVPIAAIL